MFAYLFAYLLARLSVRFVVKRFRLLAAGKGGPRMITLNLRSTTAVVRKTLCTSCVFSHIVRGHEPREELIFCGYAFPLRDVLFPVRECTDFRPERTAGAALATAR